MESLALFPGLAAGPAEPGQASPSKSSKSGKAGPGTGPAPLVKKYRPRVLEDLVGQAAAVQKVKRFAERGALTGRAWWITGRSGTGKTSLALVMAGMVADAMSIREEDATGLTPAGLEQVADDWAYTGWEKPGKVLIVNEAHGLRKDTTRAFLVLLERLPEHVAVIFTTTTKGSDLFETECPDAGPFTSRCVSVALADKGLLEPFAARAMEIAQAEGLAKTGLDMDQCRALVARCEYNLRRVLQEVEGGALLD